MSRTRRFLQFPLTRIILATFTTALAAGLAVSLGSSSGSEAGTAAWSQFLGAAVALGAYAAFVRLVERRRVSELSAARAFPELGAGLLLGALLVSAVVGLVATLGAYTWIGNEAPSSRLLLPLAEMTFVGVFEEVLCRGILFRITEQSLGSWVALTLSSLLFGLAHLPGASASLLSVSIAIVAGGFFAAAFLATRRLWLCIGAHVAWNFTLGTVFSSAVSGRESSGLVQGRLSGPEWLTGGAYGLEASVVTLLVLCTAGALLLQRAGRRGRLVTWASRRGMGRPDGRQPPRTS